jgi:hypothetical protein
MWPSALSALSRRGRGRPAGASRPRRSFRPRLEALEDRRVPVIWTVISPADNINQPGTLRWAVAQASNGDTIEIKTSQEIVLTQGELYLSHDVTIDTVTPFERISGDHLSRVFEVAPAAHVNLDNLGINDGNGVANNPDGTSADTDGGAILNQGTLALQNCVMFDNGSHNFVKGLGGAIYNNGIPNRFGTPAVGMLTLTNCRLDGNL